MIIVKLMGGLGNQMFQYATARRLAWRHGTALKLDLSFLESEQTGVTPRCFQLDHLSIIAERAPCQEVAMMTGQKNHFLETAAVQLFQKVGLAKHNPNLYCEKHFHFDPAVLTLPDNTYLEGYWQSEKYFRDIGEIIRREFIVKLPLANKNQTLAESIRATNSVSVHVRRGDYVADEKTKANHGVCNPDYYLECESRIAHIVNNPHLFVFSDDPEWVSENMKFRYPVTYVGHNGGEACQDLRLMSLCRHNIIANSSFSWWGAWLGNSPGKLVCAPARWFVSPVLDTKDLIPIKWIKIDI